MEQGSAQDAQESKRRRAIDPDQQISTGHAVFPRGRMATFEYPAITRLDLQAKTRLLIRASFDPAWLPMDGIDMNDRQTHPTID